MKKTTSKSLRKKRFIIATSLGWVTGTHNYQPYEVRAYALSIVTPGTPLESASSIIGRVRKDESIEMYGVTNSDSQIEYWLSSNTLMSPVLHTLDDDVDPNVQAVYILAQSSAEARTLALQNEIAHSHS